MNAGVSGGGSKELNTDEWCQQSLLLRDKKRTFVQNKCGRKMLVLS